jgi:hypothetical protein
MGYTTSTVHGIEVPDSAEANNIPEDIGKVVTALEGGSLVKRLTSAQIAALSSPQKPSGLVVFNTTTGKLQISDGTNFADTDATAVAAQATAAAALPKAGGTMTGNLNMGGQYVLNIGQSGASNDAATVGQVNAVAAAACPRRLHGRCHRWGHLRTISGQREAITAQARRWRLGDSDLAPRRYLTVERLSRSRRRSASDEHRPPTVR